MQGINDPYKKMNNRKKPTQNVERTENSIEEAPRVSHVNRLTDEENQRLQKSKKEELLNKQTYISPGSKRNSFEEKLRFKTVQKEENNYDTGNEDKFKLEEKKGITQIGLNSESSIDSIAKELSEEELNSDLSEDLPDDENDVVKDKRQKKKNSIGAEEKFRIHFLKSFQGMPRLSQISLVEASSKSKDANEKLPNIPEETLSKTSTNKNEETELQLPSKVNIVDHRSEEPESSEDN